MIKIIKIIHLFLIQNLLLQVKKDNYIRDVPKVQSNFRFGWGSRGLKNFDYYIQHFYTILVNLIFKKFPFIKFPIIKFPL